MEVISNYLIKSDDYFNLIGLELDEENKYKKYLEVCIKKNQNSIEKLLFDDFDNFDNSIIEHVEEKDYLMKEQELKFKIFDDISSVSKNLNNKIELIINIPKFSNIMTINKIKLSKNIKQYIFDIFVSLDNKIILYKENLYNEKIILKNINFFDKDLYEKKNYIDCSKGDVNIHIILEPNSINDIINNYVYISYSFNNYKSKVKFFNETDYV